MRVLFPFPFRALLRCQGELVDEAVFFDAGAAAFGAVVVLEERAGLADGESLFDLGLGSAGHSGQGPASHCGGEGPAFDQ